jgi:hypothetical protein
MIVKRAIGAIPYMILSAVAGLVIGWMIGGDLWISCLGAAAFFAVLAGWDIWRDRHLWNALNGK